MQAGRRIRRAPRAAQPDTPAHRVEGVRLAASILAADPAALGTAARQAAAAGADLLHLDVMDGAFVPEISFGGLTADALQRACRLPLDVHLMVARPERHVERFLRAGPAAITVHLEAFDAPAAARSTLRAIRAGGARACLALKPATPAAAAAELLEDTDGVLVMTVEPGYSGQAFQPEMLPKLAALAAVTGPRRPSMTLGVDGGIDETTLGACVQQGANLLICGSSVYTPRRSVRAAITALRRAIEAAAESVP